MNKATKFGRFLHPLLWGVGGIGLFGAILSIELILRVQLPSIESIISIENLPPHPDAVMVLGGGIEDSGIPSDALEDRLLVGERVSRAVNAPILLTGDGGRFRQAEIPVMVDWMRAHQVAPDRLVIDDEGYRTYESCKRAAQVYHLKQLVIVTQRFHLGRAIYLCRAFGIESYGVPANLRPYKKDPWFVTRDLLASVKAWIDINILSPKSPVEN